MSVLRTSVGVFAVRVWGAVVGIVVSVLIARELGPEGKGIYSLLLLVPTLLVTFGNPGLNVANVYFFGKKGANPVALAGNSLWTALTGGLLLIGVFALLYPLVGRSFFADVPAMYLFAVAATAPLLLVQSYLAGLLLATKRYRIFNLSQAAQLAVLLVTVFLSLEVFHLGLATTVTAAIVNVIAGALLTTIAYARSYPLRWTFDRTLFTRTLTYGLKGYFANAIQFLNYRLDMLLVSALIGTAAVGWYSVAVNFAELLWYVPTSIGTVLFPHVANATTGAANIITARLSRQTVLLMTGATLVVAAAAPWAVPFFFGAEFTPAVRALWYLLPGALLFSVAKIVGNDFAGRGFVLSNAIVSAAALVLNLVLNLILLPRLGIVGASLSSSISYSLHTIVMVGLFARYTGVPWYRLLWPRTSDVRDLFGLLKRAR